MRHTFESLGHQSGFYLSHLFSSTRSPSSSSSSSTSTAAIHPPPSLINWPHHHQQPPFLSAATTSINLSSPANFHSSTLLGVNSTIPHHQPKDQTHLFLHNRHPSDQPPLVIGSHGNDDLKWQNGLSFFNADGGAAAANSKLFLNPSTASDQFQKQESNIMDDKFKRSFTLPSSTMAFSSSSSSSAAASSLMELPHHDQQPVDYYGKSEGGPYQDVM